MIMKDLPTSNELDIDVRRNFILLDTLREGQKTKCCFNPFISDSYTGTCILIIHPGLDIYIYHAASDKLLYVIINRHNFV